jgi:integrase
MQGDSNRPRPRGTGSLLVRRQSDGSEVWYGKWRTDGRQVMRLLGAVHARGISGGLTKQQAEAALRGEMLAPSHAVRQSDSPNVATAGARHLEHKRSLGLKKATLMDYESTLRIHLAPFFGDTALEEIDVSMVESFVYEKQAEGKAPKSILNYLGLLHAIFTHGMKRDWCTQNPVSLVEKPRVPRHTDIRFLNLDELESILDATPPTPMGRNDRLIFLAAVMTGMRRGEAVALRWQDVDWNARVIRVRQNFTRGEFGTPKSRRSSRAVPLANRLADELQKHFSTTPYSGDLDLVFAHPATGNVLDPSKLRKRFQLCARSAGVRPVRFHDLRHTFGTQMAAAGAPLRAVQEWMGHSDHRTTLIYADYALDPHQGAHYAEQAFGSRGVRGSREGGHRP